MFNFDGCRASAFGDAPTGADWVGVKGQMRFIGTASFSWLWPADPPQPHRMRAWTRTRSALAASSPSARAKSANCSMQYKQTLPLNDHEVVITFDDGPLPPYTNIILDTLASQCVSAPILSLARWRMLIRRSPVYLPWAYHRHPQPGPSARFPAIVIAAG